LLVVEVPPEMIIPECRNGLLPKFAFYTGAGVGVQVLSSTQSRSRSRSQQ